jgi:hypothetical protein
MKFETDDRGFLRVRQPKGGSGSGISVLVVAGLVVALLVGWGGDRSGAVGSSARTAVVEQQYEQVLRDMGLTPAAHAAQTDQSCDRLLTGQLSAIVANTKCVSIRRAVFAATDAHRNAVVMSVTWIGMPSDESAAALVTVFRTGKGTVRVLAAPHVPVVSAPNASRSAQTDGRTAVLIGANTSARTVSRLRLDRATETLLRLPPL